MSLHKHALIRYRIIDNLLRNLQQPYPTVEEIRAKCEASLFGQNYGEHISVSTIEKDLKAMREDHELGFFAPIKYTRKYHGYYYTDKSYTIQKIPLKTNDIEALKFAANTLYNFKESDLFSELSFAIEKIFDRLHISREVQDVRLKSVVQFDTYPNYAGSTHLPLIYKAITKQEKMSLAYQKFNTLAFSKRIIHPYLLKEHRHRWYVIAYDENKEQILTFGLDRIQSIVGIKETFIKSPEFNADNFFKNAFGITQSNQSATKVILHFNKSLHGYLNTQQLHHSQQIKIYPDYIELKLYLIPAYELIEKILSYGNQVKVQYPPSLQKQITHHLKTALDQYSN